MNEELKFGIQKVQGNIMELEELKKELMVLEKEYVSKFEASNRKFEDEELIHLAKELLAKKYYFDELLATTKEMHTDNVIKFIRNSKKH